MVPNCIERLNLNDNTVQAGIDNLLCSVGVDNVDNALALQRPNPIVKENVSLVTLRPSDQLV